MLLNLLFCKQKTRIGELEAALATKDVEFEGKLHRELNPLKEQLNLHAQTTGILVGEKAELTAALLQSQTTAKQKVGEILLVSLNLFTSLIISLIVFFFLYREIEMK